MLKARTILMGSATIAACITSSALAQTAPAGSVPASQDTGQLEDIVVTAQKRSERLQDVPIAITAVTSDTLTKSGVQGLAGLSVAVPGLNVNNTFGRLTLSLRGVGSTTVGAGIENPIALYVDGVYFASTSASLLSLNNIAQVAVLKGPQGTLFGRNATGGLIQVTTRDPTSRPEVEARLTYGNYNTVIGSLYAATGITDDLAADIAVFAKHQGDGWGVNRFTGKDIYDVDHDVSVRSKWVFQPSELTKITVIADYENVRDTMLASTIRAGSISPFFPGVVQPDLGYDNRTTSVPPHMIRSGGASAKLDQRIGSLSFASITAYRKSRTVYGGDVDGLEQNLSSFLWSQRDHQFSQELQLSNGSKGRLRWTAGAYLYDGVSGLDPAYTYLPTSTLFWPHVSVRIKSLAGYGQATYALFDETNITLGGRYTYEKRTAFDRQRTLIPASGPSTMIDLPPASITAKRFTYRASIDHRFSPAVLAYASANRGFKAGGFNLTSPGSAPFQPETLDAYEVGLKTDLLDNRVRLNVAGFYNIYKNIQVQRYQTTIQTVNGGRARTYGVEGELTALLAPQLQLTTGFTLVSPEFTEFASCVRAAPQGGVPLFPGNCTGNQLPIASKLTVTAALDYTFDLAGGSLNLHPNLYYNSGYYTDVANAIHQPRFAKAGFTATWTAPDEHLTLGVYGTNLSDRRVVTYGDSQSSGSQLVTFAEPRTFGVTVGYKM